MNNNPFQQAQQNQTRQGNPFGENNQTQSQSNVFGRSNNLAAAPSLGSSGNPNFSSSFTNNNDNSKNPFTAPTSTPIENSGFGVSSFGTSKNVVFGSSVSTAGKDGGDSNPFGTSPFGVGQSSNIRNTGTGSWRSSIAQSKSNEFTSPGFGSNTSKITERGSSFGGRFTEQQTSTFGSGSNVGITSSPFGSFPSVSSHFQQKSHKSNDIDSSKPIKVMKQERLEESRKGGPISKLNPTASTFQPRNTDLVFTKNENSNTQIQQQREDAAKKIATLKARLAEKRALLASKSSTIEKVTEATEDNEVEPKDMVIARNPLVSDEFVENSSSTSVRKPKRALKPSCKTMCPLKEIEERQESKEISMLEQLHPKIFPLHFTLRDTCVKRFRRSAADVDLGKDEEVRDPITLEKTMAYLEEWIMERDRQGIDPRSANNTVPAPLDVYQFMWNRTRMLRKDFLLQNIPKMTKHTNSNIIDLDTINIAIRVHERITRWHVLCEHQMAHLEEWKDQSSQNLVEMGQCLKSLNMLYDQRRLLVKNGSKASSTASQLLHGCSSGKVLGPDPIDYDGQMIQNSETSDTIVGKRGSLDGTNEAEMRGLYILLMFHQNTDFKNFLISLPPELHRDPIVKLALNVVLSIRHGDFGTFFRLLRNRCGYLYSCVMFKQVRIMRKHAISIMTKVYKMDSSGYPIDKLTFLLCFNNNADTLSTLCRYNIHFNEDLMIIDFCSSSFEDPGEKVQVTKMKVIEDKVKGTRLFICRGGCSVEQNITLSQPQARNITTNTSTKLSQNISKEEVRQEQIVLKQQALLKDQLRKQAMEEEEERYRRERMKIEAKEEEVKRREIERKMEVEIQRRIAQQKHAEEAISAKLKRSQEEEEQKSNALKLQEEERNRKEVLRLKAEEAAEKKRLEHEAEARKREQEELERKRREVIELQRIEREKIERVERERLLLEAAERMKRQNKVNMSTISFYWRLWQENANLRKARQTKKARLSLDRMYDELEHVNLGDFHISVSQFIESQKFNELVAFGNMLSRTSSDTRKNLFSSLKASPSNRTTLLKVGLVLPMASQLNRSLESWLESRLNNFEVYSSFRLRIATVIIREAENLYGCDCIVFIRSPCANMDEMYDENILHYTKFHPSQTLTLSNFDISEMKISMLDKALKRCFVVLVENSSPRYVVKTNLATIMRSILKFFSANGDIANIQLLNQMCREMKKKLSPLPDKYQDFPAIDFATEGYVENYFVYDNENKDLPFNWRSKNEKALNYLTTIFSSKITKSADLLSLLETNDAPDSLLYQVSQLLHSNCEYLAMVSSLTFLERNYSLNIILPEAIHDSIVKDICSILNSSSLSAHSIVVNPFTHDTAFKQVPYRSYHKNKKRQAAHLCVEPSKPSDPVEKVEEEKSKAQNDFLLEFLEMAPSTVDAKRNTPKRSRISSNDKCFSNELKGSKRFTNQLEQLVSGNATYDLTIGESRLFLSDSLC